MGNCCANLSTLEQIAECCQLQPAATPQVGSAGYHWKKYQISKLDLTWVLLVFFVGFSVKSKLGKNAKYPILNCKLDFF